MQIHVNLLPGTRKTGKASRAAAFNLGATLRGMGGQAKDPWLLGSAGAVIASLATVGLLFTSQEASADEVAQRLDRALRDSTRLTSVLEARRKMTSERDSVERQVAIIRTIDDNRYIWAHLLDEISAALPAYTWLLSLEQTSKPELPPGAAPVAEAAAGKAAKGKAAKGKAEKAAAAEAASGDTIVIHQPVAFRLVGQTVDMQALTQFMKDLEGSPFVKNVTLVKSEIVVVETKDVTQFQLEAEFEVPTKDLLTIEPLVVPVR